MPDMERYLLGRKIVERFSKRFLAGPFDILASILVTKRIDR